MSEPLAPKEEALLREGLRTASPLSAEPKSYVDALTAEWAERCRRLLATLDRARSGSLDDAWAEAEAALPEGWQIGALDHVLPRTGGRSHWEADAGPVVNGVWDLTAPPNLARGATPVAAMRALAAKLRKVGR